MLEDGKNIEREVESLLENIAILGGLKDIDWLLEDAEIKNILGEYHEKFKKTHEFCTRNIKVSDIPESTMEEKLKLKKMMIDGFFNKYYNKQNKCNKQNKMDLTDEEMKDVIEIITKNKNETFKEICVTNLVGKNKVEIFLDKYIAINPFLYNKIKDKLNIKKYDDKQFINDLRLFKSNLRYKSYVKELEDSKYYISKKHVSDKENVNKFLKAYDENRVDSFCNDCNNNE